MGTTLDGVEREEGREERLDERVVSLLSRTLGSIAFTGLRRSLNAHPESLSRTLRRLQRDGVVRRASGGYALAATPPTNGTGPNPPARALASAQLPLGIDRADLLGRLAGRWFGNLRWVGVYDRPDEPWMVWSVDGSRSHLILRVGTRSLRIFAETPPGTPVEAVVASAAQELLAQALTRLRPGAPPGSRESTPLLRASDPDGVLGFAS